MTKGRPRRRIFQWSDFNFLVSYLKYSCLTQIYILSHWDQEVFGGKENRTGQTENWNFFLSSELIFKNVRTPRGSQGSTGHYNLIITIVHIIHHDPATVLRNFCVLST